MTRSQLDRVGVETGTNHSVHTQRTKKVRIEWYIRGPDAGKIGGKNKPLNRSKISIRVPKLDLISGFISGSLVSCRACRFGFLSLFIRVVRLESSYKTFVFSACGVSQFYTHQKVGPCVAKSQERTRKEVSKLWHGVICGPRLKSK